MMHVKYTSRVPVKVRDKKKKRGPKSMLKAVKK